MNTYVFSDAERQEIAINTIYDCLSEFSARENKNFSLPRINILRSMVLFVVSLAVINIAALLYIVSMWS